MSVAVAPPLLRTVDLVRTYGAGDFAGEIIPVGAAAPGEE